MMGCDVCVYYKRPTDPKMLGECHRFPPQVGVGDYSCWPHVKASDLCGEYIDVGTQKPLPSRRR